MNGLGGVARIHTDAGGRVWVRAEGDTRCVGSVQSFLQSPEFRYCSQFWAVGDRCNAELLTELWPHRTATRIIRIGSPAICSTAEEREDPNAVLANMDSLIGQPASTGGLHTMTTHDYTVYQLAATMEDSHYIQNSTARHLVKYHPAWPALSFIPSLDIDQACVMLARIIDPRWYISPGRPNRLQRLHAYLGLQESNFHQPDGHNAMHAMAAQEAWSSLMSEVSPPDLEDPANFLWRIAARNDYSGRGYHLATRKFVQFVRSVWLDTLVVSKRFDGWFVPEYFFSTDAEIAAFREHRKRFKVSAEKAI